MTTKDSIQVDAYLEKHSQWSKVLASARKVLLSEGLEETIKWGAPTYTVDGKNVISLAGFKHHCAVWFYNGVYLKDPDQRLVNAQEGSTKGLRQWRLEAGEKLPIGVLRAYVREAVANQRAGLQVKAAPRAKNQPLELPVELEALLSRDKQLAGKFDSLTPGRQREYAQHIASAKQEKTRIARAEKAVPLILAGQGLYEKYKNC